MRALTVMVAVLAVGATPGKAARGEENAGLDWLSAEPVTLLDLGIVRFRLDLEAASNWLLERGHLSRAPLSGVFYEWRNRTIVAYVTVREMHVDPTKTRCRQTFARVVDRLLADGPGGPESSERYLEALFMHTGSGNWRRPRDLGADLVGAVRFEVTLLPPPPIYAGGSSVRCFGRLDADPEDIAFDVSD